MYIRTSAFVSFKTHPIFNTPRVQILSISCSFWENCMSAPPGELAPPTRGNPGSATAVIIIIDTGTLTPISHHHNGHNVKC